MVSTIIVVLFLKFFLIVADPPPTPKIWKKHQPSTTSTSHSWGCIVHNYHEDSNVYKISWKMEKKWVLYQISPNNWQKLSSKSNCNEFFISSLAVLLARYAQLPPCGSWWKDVKDATFIISAAVHRLFFCTAVSLVFYMFPLLLLLTVSYFIWVEDLLMPFLVSLRCKHVRAAKKV